MSLQDLTLDPNLTENHFSRSANKKTIKYLERKSIADSYDYLLDVGRPSPLTLEMDCNLKCRILNTSGDLDCDFNKAKIFYKEIVYSHTIEHQFNPLFTLQELKKVMYKDSQLFIILPRRPKFLWSNQHFHEIDDYRMRLLIERAGMKIVSIETHKAWRAWYDYLKGFRMFLRLFFETNSYYEIKLK